MKFTWTREGTTTTEATDAMPTKDDSKMEPLHKGALKRNKRK